ncbi:MAG: ROK family protein [bacterium]|nr:ROK family protein [bacterium]
MSFIIGLDIGGTKIDGIFVRNGKILRNEKIATPRSRKAFLKSLEALIYRLKGENKLTGIGIACAGLIEARTATILKSPNLKFLEKLRLAEIISKKFRVRIGIDNDTHCFLRGEQAFGLARGKKNVVALTLGTGVGGAVLISGKILQGSHVSAAELGHMVINGRNESVEDLCSSHFFEQYKLGGALTVQRAAEKGNKKAKLIYKEFGQNLGVALANLVNIFDPELIILGGGIARGAHLFMRETSKEMAKYSLVPRRFLPQISLSKLKHAGALGATKNAQF